MRTNNTKLRSFSWDDSPEKSKSQELIKDTVLEWYSTKHLPLSDKEISFINSIDIKACLFCDSYHIVKSGKRKDRIQRYLCIDCNKRFNPLSNTLFDSHKIPMSEWIEYLLHLFEFHSIRTSAFDSRNADSTGHYWLKKVFKQLEGIQDNVVLKDTIWLDETFLPRIKSQIITSNGKKLRGISKNKICIACAKDSHGYSFKYFQTFYKKHMEYIWISY